MTLEQIQEAINDNVFIQKVSHPDSPEHASAMAKNRELFALCQQRGYAYHTEGSQICIHGVAA